MKTCFSVETTSALMLTGCVMVTGTARMDLMRAQRTAVTRTVHLTNFGKIGVIVIAVVIFIHFDFAS